MLKFFLRPKMRVRIWALLVTLICFIGPVRQSAARFIQATLSHMPGMKGKIPPPVEILHFDSLVPDQPVDPSIKKEIGPEGGTIELMNVARLEIPPRALDRPTLIEIHQVLEVESTKQLSAQNSHDASPGAVFPGFDFITPVVRLEPCGLKLKVPATLYLPTDAARVGTNNPELIHMTASESASRESWFFDPYLKALGTPDAPAKITIQSPLKLNYLVYAAKQFPAFIPPKSQAK